MSRSWFSVTSEFHFRTNVTKWSKPLHVLGMIHWWEVAMKTGLVGQQSPQYKLQIGQKVERPGWRWGLFVPLCQIPDPLCCLSPLLISCEGRKRSLSHSRNRWWLLPTRRGPISLWWEIALRLLLFSLWSLAPAPNAFWIDAARLIKNFRFSRMPRVQKN